MHAYTTSISMVWLINTPILGVGLLLGASMSQYILEGCVWILIIMMLLAVLFLRPYTLKRTVVRSEQPKEQDVEAGEATNTEKIVEKDASPLAAAPAAGNDEVATAEARRSISKTRTSDGGDDVGTISEEPEVTKQ